jgi:hypothetical protein
MYEPTQAFPYEQFTTLTGYTMREALAKMNEVLEPNAYKAVSGTAVSLTDIKPAYLTMVLSQVFGPAGLGWHFDYSGVDKRESGYTNSKGVDKTRWVATIDRLEFRYRYIVGDQMYWSLPILANGGSDSSDNPEYAMRGALTNALGAAASKLCWQLRVYMGKLDHTTAAKQYEDQQKRRNMQVTKEELEVYEEPEDKAQDQAEEPTVAKPVQQADAGTGRTARSEPNVQNVPVHTESGTQVRQAFAPKPEPQQQGNGAAPAAPVATAEVSKGPHSTTLMAPPMPANPVEKKAWAEAMVIPSDVPIPVFLHGKTLGDIIKTQPPNMGVLVTKFIAGTAKNGAGKLFDIKALPADQHNVTYLEALKDAATLLAPSK